MTFKLILNGVKIIATFFADTKGDTGDTSHSPSSVYSLCVLTTPNIFYSCV